MALSVGQNSWTTIIEADDYLTDRIGAEAWFDLADSGDPGADSKTSFLISAYQWLIGAPQLELSADLTDVNVKRAQMEAALFLLEHYKALNERRAALFTGVTEFVLSRKSEKLNIDNLTIPIHIIGLLRDYLVDIEYNTVALLKGHYDV